MFCSKCGAQIAEGAKFCPSCGTAVNGQSVEVVADNNSQLSERENSLNELSKMLEYFSQKKNQYCEYYSVSYNLELEKKTKLSKSAIRKALLFSFISMVGSIILMNVGIKNDLMVLAIIGALLGFFCFISLLGGDIIYARIVKKNTIKKLSYREEELKNELIDYYNKYVNCPVGIEYSSPDDIERMMNIITSGRAAKLNEAINLLIDDEHKKYLERNIEETVHLAREAADSSAMAARSASRAEWNSYRR